LRRRKSVKKVYVVLLSLALALIPLGSAVADKGGVPNENAEYGQTVSTVAQEGGMGQYMRSGSEARTEVGEATEDGKFNGKNGGLLDWLKNLISSANSETEPEPESGDE